MNHLETTILLKNQYFILRHGESEANIAKQIRSNPDEGITTYGLTDTGKSQVAISTQQAMRRGWLNDKTIIYSSDFKRAAETAKVVEETLHTGKIQLSSALRERYFGNWDGKHSRNYIRVWGQDISGFAQSNNGVESVSEVLDRVTRLIGEIETRYDGKNILLVSHGDPLHILQAAFAGLKPSKHRLLKNIKVAEIRKLTFKVRKS